MRKLIGHTAGRFVLQAIIVSILFPAMLWGWGRKPDRVAESVKLVSAPLCFKSLQPSNSLLDADIVELARRYRVISDAQTGFTAEQRARLREIRPGIQISRYMSMAAVFSPLKIQLILTNHPDWVMRDASGNPVPSRATPGGLMMDPKSEGWRDYILDRAILFMQQGYDGIMGDAVLMCGKLGWDFIGINTETDRPYTTEEYRCHQLELVKAVKSAIGEGNLVLNSVWRGSFYFRQEPYPFVDAADGVVAEGFRGGINWSLGSHLSDVSWLANLEMMRDVQARGKAIVAVVKVTKAVTEGYRPGELERWEKFWYCTFLLGLGDSAFYVASISDPTVRGGKTALFYPHHEIDLGKPINEFWKTGSGYRRGFEWGSVLVNLTTHKGMILRKVPIKDEENSE